MGRRGEDREDDGKPGHGEHSIDMFMRHCTRRGCLLQRSKKAAVVNKSVKVHDISWATYRDCVFARVPARMQDLLVKVQRLECHVLPHPTAWSSVLDACLIAWQRTSDLLCLECRLVRLKDDVIQGLDVKYPEIVVV